jgi:hypothetical protein
MSSIPTTKSSETFYASSDGENDDDSISSESSSDTDIETKKHSSAAKEDENDDNDENDEDLIKIRQKAFELINKAGGPSDEDRKSRQWPQSPDKLQYSHQSAGERSSASAPNYQSPYQQSSSSQAQRQFQQSSYYNGPAQSAHVADKLSVTELFVNCVSDVCKVSSSEIVKTGVSILSSGYQSIANYRDTPISGSYDPIDTSQHGYGNGNGSNRMRGRYRD